MLFRSASQLLRLHGAQVRTAADGIEALQQVWQAHAEQAPVHAVLMDLQMPGMDGLVATRALRSDPRGRDLLILAVTAATGRAEHDAALEAGMDRVVHKPCDMAQLLPLLQALHPRSDTAPPEALAPPAWPALPGIDLQRAQLNTGDDVALWRRQLHRLFDEFGDLQYVTPWLLDAQVLARRMHKLAGHAALLGADGLANSARAAQAQAQAHGPGPAGGEHDTEQLARLRLAVSAQLHQLGAAATALGLLASVPAPAH